MTVKSDMTSNMNCDKREVAAWEKKCTWLLYVAMFFCIVPFVAMSITNLAELERLVWLSWLCVTFLLWAGIKAIHEVQNKIMVLLQKTVAVRMRGVKSSGMSSS